MKNKRGQNEILTTSLIILLVIAFIVIVWQMVASITDGGKDEKYVERYVKEIYPEYINCSMDYSCSLSDCSYINCRSYCGAKIYCDNKTYDDRDSLRIGRPEQATPTLQIQFKNITIEEIKNYYKVRDKK